MCVCVGVRVCSKFSLRRKLLLIFLIIVFYIKLTEEHNGSKWKRLHDEKESERKQQEDKEKKVLLTFRSSKMNSGEILNLLFSNGKLRARHHSFFFFIRKNFFHDPFGHFLSLSFSPIIYSFVCALRRFRKLIGSRFVAFLMFPQGF